MVAAGRVLARLVQLGGRDMAGRSFRWLKIVAGAFVGGLVGTITCTFLGFAVQVLTGPTWFLIFEPLGFVMGGLGGLIAGLAASFEQQGSGRRPSTWRGRLLAASPLLIGVALVVWRFGLSHVNEARRLPLRPIETLTAPGPAPAPAVQPTTGWDIVKDDTARAIGQSFKALKKDLDPAFGVMVLMGFAIAAIVYGAILGGWAVRRPPNRDDDGGS
jgi:hypothetical protein